MGEASSHRDVLSGLVASLPGRIDVESPPIHVTGVDDVTGPGEVMGVEVAYSIDGGRTRRRAFRWTEWEPFGDGSAAAVASGMDMLIRVELREELNSVPPDLRPTEAPASD